VPEVRLVLTELLAAAGGLRLGGERVGVVGHSFGGWTALATTDQEPRVTSVVALAPGGASRPRPGIIPVVLEFAWGRDVPTLYLAGDEDVMTPLDGITELYERTPAAARMFVLLGVDHLHFVDDVRTAHKSLRLDTLDDGRPRRSSATPPRRAFPRSASAPSPADRIRRPARPRAPTAPPADEPGACKGPVVLPYERAQRGRPRPVGPAGPTRPRRLVR
jgi:dienelactone hydrolase